MKKVIIISNQKRDPRYHYAQMTEALLVNAGFQVLLYDIENDSSDEKTVFEDAFAIIVLGGDGTILNAAHTSSRYKIPILAINLGRLGYIAQLEKNAVERIADILLSDFKVEERAMLSVQLYRQKQLVFRDDHVLNDAVIGKLNGYGIIENKLIENKTLINCYRGDGVIVSTATGSTAYAMSAGGPVIDPTLRIIEVTPLATHSLKARPIIFSGDHALEITISPAEVKSCLTLDGETTIPLETYDCIRVGLSQYTTKLIAQENDFCKILYQKMTDL